MSMAALLVGATDHLLSNNGHISLAAGECDVRPDGSPTEASGDWFVAVHPAEWSNQNDAGTALDESFGFQVTISARGRRTPPSAWGREILCRPRQGTGAGGLYARAEAIRAALHGNYTALTRVNSLITLAATANQATANGFDAEPIFFANCSIPMKRPPGWWGSVDAPENGSPWAGLSVTLSFRPVRRVQDIASQT